MDFSNIARQVISQIGYTENTFNAKTCSILTSIRESRHDIESLFDERNLSETKIFVNPESPVIIGGPSVHSGLTGRKNAVDTEIF